MKTYYGLNANYKCKDVALGSGAEGAVYETTDGKMVVKTFNNSAYLPEAEMRIKHMLAHKPILMEYDDHAPMFAWPLDIVYSDPRHKHFIGYIMLRLNRSFHSLIVALRPAERLQLFGHNSFRLSAVLAYNVIQLTRTLNLSGYHLSDLNPSNMMVDAKGHICMIDCDSLSFTANGIHFTPEVTTFNYLPPELQNFSRKKNPPFGAAADSFMVAVIIWQFLLFYSHPFQRGHWNGKKTGTIIPDNISYGNSLWETPAKGYPDAKSLLPATTIDLFRRTFSYTHTEITRSSRAVINRRPTLDEWHNELATILQLDFTSSEITVPANTQRPVRPKKQSDSSLKATAVQTCKPHSPTATTCQPQYNQTIQTAATTITHQIYNQTTQNTATPVTPQAHKQTNAKKPLWNGLISAVLSYFQFCAFSDSIIGIDMLIHALGGWFTVIAIYLATAIAAAYLTYYCNKDKWFKYNQRLWMPWVIPALSPIILLHIIGLCTIIHFYGDPQFANYIIPALVLIISTFVGEPVTECLFDNYGGANSTKAKKASAFIWNTLEVTSILFCAGYFIGGIL